LLLIFALSDCSKHQGSGGLARLKPCRLPGIDEKLLCGQLTVFENRLTRTGRAIELNVVMLPAFDQKTKAEPLFDLAGGPGAASTDGVNFYANDGHKLDDDPIYTLRLSQAVHAMAGLRNDDVSAVG
jgi:hypothetical protein